MTVGLWLAWCLGHALLWPSPARRAAWRRAVFGLWGRAVLRAVGVELAVGGSPPGAPCLVVANHLSYLDIPVLAACLPTVFVSKAEVRRWPVIGLMAQSMGTLFVRREQKRDLPQTNRAIAGALARGDAVVLFPEGTSTQGSRVAPFRAPLLDEAARRGLPVHYASLRYATASGDPPASRAVCWWGDMAFAPHALELLGLRRISAEVHFGREPIREGNRKLLAEKLWHAVDELFIPVA